MRWLLLKDLQLLRRSPLVTGLLVVYPIVLAVLIGLAISRGPEKPRVAFLNQIPTGTGLSLGNGGFSQDEAQRQLCAKVECVDVSSRAEVEQKVKDGDVLGGLILPPDFISKLQAELSTNGTEPATVDVIVNNDDPLKAQLVDDRISSLLTQANLLSPRRSAASPGTTSRSSPTAASSRSRSSTRPSTSSACSAPSRSSTPSRQPCRPPSEARSRR